MSSKPAIGVKIQREPYDEYVGRPSEFGNPWKVGRHGSLPEVLKLYEEYIRDRAQKYPRFRNLLLSLYGKRLGCPCPHARCHAHVLADVVNELHGQHGARGEPGGGL